MASNPSMMSFKACLKLTFKCVPAMFPHVPADVPADVPANVPALLFCFKKNVPADVPACVPAHVPACSRNVPACSRKPPSRVVSTLSRRHFSFQRSSKASAAE